MRSPAFRSSAAHAKRLPSRAAGSATVAWLGWLAPFIAVAAMSYPLLVWPLFEAQVVSLDPVYGAPSVDGPPSPLLRIYFSTLFALSLVTLIAQQLDEPIELRWPPLVTVSIFIAWAGMTSLWAVEPDISFRRFLLTVFIATSIIAPVVAAREPERLLRVAFWAFGLMTALSAWSVLTTPPTALGHAAFYPHKNYFAAVTSIMVLFAIYQILDGRGIYRAGAVVMLVLGLWFLAEARSKTCIALIMLVPPLSYGSAFAARYLRLSPALVLTAVFVGAYGIYEFGAQSGFWDFHSFAETFFSDPTLTQRTDIWNFALKKIPERFWLGYGFEVFWGASHNSPSIREAPGFVAQMPHAHNGYLDVILQTGAVGLSLLAILLATSLHYAGRVARHSFALSGFCLSLLIFNLLYNLLETTWFRSFGLKSMTVALAIAIVAIGVRRGDEP